MRRLARDGEFSSVVRQTAQQLTAGLRQKDFTGEVVKIHEFVRDHIRYVRDPVHGELVQTPEVTLAMKSGDCDDKATLTCALLGATGHKCRFVAIGKVPNFYSHVYVETKLGGYWVPLETTEPWPAGKAPTRFAAKMRLEV